MRTSQWRRPILDPMNLAAAKRPAIIRAECLLAARDVAPPGQLQHRFVHKGKFAYTIGNTNKIGAILDGLRQRGGSSFRLALVDDSARLGGRFQCPRFQLAEHFDFALAATFLFMRHGAFLNGSERHNPAIMLVDIAAVPVPVVEFVGRHVEPHDELTQRPSPSSPTRAGQDPRFGTAYRAEPRPWSEFLKSFLLGQYAPRSVRPKSHPSSGSASPDVRFVPVRADGSSKPCAGKPPSRSRRTPSSSGRTPSAGVPIRHTYRRSALLPQIAFSELRLSLRASSASVASLCIHSVILPDDVFLHSQVRKDDQSNPSSAAIQFNWSCLLLLS